MTERDRFQINDADTGCDELEIVAAADGFTLTVEEAWAGDSETGFGRSCSIQFGHDRALELAEWIIANVKKRD